MCVQIDLAEGDDQLRSLFNDLDNESILLETGFRLALCHLTCADKKLIKSAIRDYHSLVKIKPELDQFADGLKTLGVLEAMKKQPSLMTPLFTKHESIKRIDKGMCVYVCYLDSLWLLHSYLIDYFRSIFEVIFSDIDRQRRDKEEATYIHFMDFVDDCQGMLWDNFLATSFSLYRLAIISCFAHRIKAYGLGQ